MVKFAPSAKNSDIAKNSIHDGGDRAASRTKWLVASYLLLALFLAGISWLCLTGVKAEREIATVQLEISKFSGSKNLTNPDLLAEMLVRSRNHAHRAHSLVSGPVWWSATQLPFFGRSPTAVRAITTSIDQVLQGTLDFEKDLRDIKSSSNASIDPQLAVAVGKCIYILNDSINESVDRMDALNLSLVPSVISDPALKLKIELERVQPYLNEGTSIASAIPTLLGISKPRTWLLVFENGAEARATGGFPGAWGVLTADNGELSLKSLESNNLIASQPLKNVSTSVSRDAITLYGSDLTRLSDMNLSPDYPFNAKLMWSLYRQSTGTESDGVIAMDEHVLASLMTVTGPVTVDGFQVTRDNAVEYVTKFVYAKYPEPDMKDAALIGLIQTVFRKLKVGASPLTLIQVLMPAAKQGRIKAWSNDSIEEGIFSSSIFGGSLANKENPTHAVVLINGAGNKIDAYVQSNVMYEGGKCEPAFLYRDSTMEVSLRNSAPASGLPFYVTPRNDLKQLEPSNPGSTKMIVYVHVPLGSEFKRAFVAGMKSPLILSGQENNRTVWRFDVELPANSTRKLIVMFAEPATGREPTPTLWVQPMTLPMVTSVAPGLSCN